MRKKIAMRWRRQVLRRGAEILSEGMVFSKRELRENGYVRRDNGYQVRAKYKRNTYSVADDDILKCYKLLSWCMDVEDEEEADQRAFIQSVGPGLATPEDPTGSGSNYEMAD